MYVVLALVGHEGLLTLCGTRTPSRHGGRGWNKRDRSSVLRSEGPNDRDRADRPARVAASVISRFDGGAGAGERAEGGRRERWCCVN